MDDAPVASSTTKRGESISDVFAPDLLTHATGRNRKGEEFGVFCQNILKGYPIIDDNIIPAKVGLGKMTSVIPAVDLHMVRVALNLNMSLMNQSPVSHISHHITNTLNKI